MCQPIESAEFLHYVGTGMRGKKIFKNTSFYKDSQVWDDLEKEFISKGNCAQFLYILCTVFTLCTYCFTSFFVYQVDGAIGM